MIDGEFAGVDLKHLAGIVFDAERDHVQQRSPGQLELVGCSCGAAYKGDDPYEESQEHQREVFLRETLRALTGACDTCRGSGEWRKFGGTYVCPDCDGLGLSMLPLPLMQYRDDTGEVWCVTQVRNGAALVEPRGRP